MSKEILKFDSINLSFGPTQALQDINLSFSEGEVHALIGENGAGKSSLMKVLSGAYIPDNGTITLFGEPYSPRSPLDGRTHGIAMVYQELNLAKHLTVEENITLGMERRQLGFVQRQHFMARIAKALELLHHPEIHPDRRVETLSIGAQQLVEVARALVTDAKIIVMDEPTSSLSTEDIGHLFDVIRQLKKQGVTIIYISHFLEEVQEIADRFSVLRDGRCVGTGDIADYTEGQIVKMMVGRTHDEMFPKVPHSVGEVVLSVENLHGGKLPRGVSFELRRGEILGIAGLVGSGRTEMMRALFGLDRSTSGTVSFASSVAASEPQKIGLLSEDRKNEGLAQGLSIRENITLSNLRPFTRFGWLPLGPLSERAIAGRNTLGIVCRSIIQLVAELSGGNQQKVAIARLIDQDAEILLLDEPTRGIDVSSKVQIYELMGKLAARGKAMLFVSSYLPELLGICDRIAVMHKGKLSEARPPAEWDEHSLMLYATSGKLTN